MSPRPSRLRKISNPPVVSGFIPYGRRPGSDDPGKIFLHLEEYEALRLCDHAMMNHNQAALLMQVSRPTLTRIYSRARQKIADAIVNGKSIIIEGGKVFYDTEWYSCLKCGCHFNNPEKQTEVSECPLCKSDLFVSIADAPENPETIN